MKIEDAIKQKKPFRTPHHRVIVNLIYTHNWVSDQIKAMLKAFDITQQQYNVLRVLRGAGEPISTSVIRDRLLDKMSDTSRMVDRLYQKGLVTRSSCKHDKRLVDVSLSTEGKKLLAEIDKYDDQMDGIVSGNITKEEALQLSELLDKLRGSE